MSDFPSFIERPASEKTTLVTIGAALQLAGWTLDSGAIWKIPFTKSTVITSIEESGTQLVEASSTSLSSGEWFFDLSEQVVYVRTLADTDPNEGFIGVFFSLFFSDSGAKAPYDLTLTGREVDWLPLIRSTSQFGVQVDNKDTQLGFALEGSGQISFLNDEDFWQKTYDKVFFENQKVFIYSWGRDLPITESQIIYRGRVQKKQYTQSQITFTVKDVLNELRNEIVLGEIQDVTYTHEIFGSVNASDFVPERDLPAKQRRIYGRVNGMEALNIDQVLRTGYPALGSVNVTTGSQVITPDGITDWPLQLKQGDQLIFAIDALQTRYTIETTAGTSSLNTITLSEQFTGPTGTTTMIIFPQRETQGFNRHFHISNDILTQPEATITDVESNIRFRVDDPSGFIPGDTVSVSGINRTLSSINDTNLFVLEQAIIPTPVVSDTFLRNPLTNVYLNRDILQEGVNNDYTFDLAESVLKLNNTDENAPEARLASINTLSGTLSFTLGSIGVGGTGTSFLAEVIPGDLINAPNSGTFFQVFSVEDDTSLRLTKPADTTSSTGTTRIKRPEYFLGGPSTLSLDVLGISSDGTATGDLLTKGPEIVQDILVRAGLEDDLDLPSFDSANELINFHDVGVLIPRSFKSVRGNNARDIIGDINRSIFGSLFQDFNFNLSYDVIDPGKEGVDVNRYQREDVLSFGVNSDSSKIVRRVELGYDQREFDFRALESSEAISSFGSDIGQFLIKTQRVFEVSTRLSDQSSANIFASRWALLLEIAKSIVTMRLKLKAHRNQIGDVFELTHENLYQRFGSTALRKMGVVNSITRSGNAGTVSFDDLGNAFNRVATIAENDASEYTSATVTARMINGYITDNVGLSDADPETKGINVIW